MTCSEPKSTSGRAFACERTSRPHFLERFRAFTRSSTGRTVLNPDGGFSSAINSSKQAIILYALLRRLRPKRIIEVGSGFSSALMLDSNDRFLDGSICSTFIEPYPERLRSLLTEHDKGRIELLQTAVQSVPRDVFAPPVTNDILFIDSSHVTKIGSDVNYLLFEILPRLKPGVVVHVHDVMWPFEYPKEWLMEGRAWNEA